MRVVVGALLGLAFAGQAIAQVPKPNTPNLPKNDGALLAVWTQFVAGDDLSKPNTKIEVRYALRGGATVKCSIIDVQEDGASNASVHLRGQMSEKDPRGTPKPDDYDVQICAAPLSASTKSVTLMQNGSVAMVYNGDALRVAVKDLPGPAMLGARRMGKIKGIALGDSGCRGDGQNCQYDWALKTLADDAVKQNPDFVLHVGDYHYFHENDYDFWHDQHGGNRFGYWLQEFLVPAGGLLRAAPWIMGRGNHERCSRQWVGNAWHVLFDPRGPVKGDPCKAKDGPKARPGIPSTWAVDLAPRDGSTPSFRFFVIDNVNAGKDSAQGYLDAANASILVDGGKAGWISHYPPIKFAYYKSRWNYGEFNVKSDISSAFGTGASPCVVGQPCVPSLIFAGHQHFFQEIEFWNAKIPVVAIVGHGGVLIGTGQQPGDPNDGPSTCSRDLSTHMPFSGAGHAQVNTAQYHGYMVLERDSKIADRSGWNRSYAWTGVPARFMKNGVLQYNDIGTCPHN